MPSKLGTEATAYKAHLTSLLRGRSSLTTADAQALIKELKSPDFTQVKEFYLAGFVTRNADKFEPGAAALVSAAIKHTHPAIEPETGLVGPRLLGDPGFTLSDARAHDVTWEKRAGSTTVNGFNADDPMQGNIGDCYLVSALSAVANSHPELLEKNLKVNRDGTYTVTFYERADMNKPAKPVQITVDGDFPVKGHSLEYMSARETRELWPLIYEKAYAQWKGSYGHIESGMGAQALEALTGAKPSYFPITHDAKPTEVLAQVKAALANRGCVVAISQPFGTDVRNMVDDHEYAVLGVTSKNGQALIQVRNPWGEKEPGADGKDDGVFTLTPEEFVRAFAMVESVRPLR